MNYDKFDLKSKMLISVLFSILAFINVTIVINYPEDTVLIAIVAFVSGGLFIFAYLQYFHYRKSMEHLEELSECISFVAKNSQDAKLIRKSKYLSPIYDKIEQMHAKNLEVEEGRQKILSIVNSVAINMEIEKLLEDLMPKLIEATKSNCGAFYLANQSTGKLEIKKSIGFSKNLFSEFDITIGEGFIGECVVHKNIKIINDIPDDTIYIMRTFIGKVKPKSLLIIPIISHDVLVGVFAFASIFNYSEDQIEMIELIKYYLGAAVENGMTFEKTKKYLNEVKFQNRLIQSLNDDLEKKIQDRTVFLNYIIDSIRDYAVYAMDKDAKIILWSKGAEVLFGFTNESVIGKHVENIFPSDEVAAGYVKRRLETVVRDGRLIESGWRFRKDGSNYYGETVIFARYDQEGHVTDFTTITKDITSMKNLESQLWYEKEFSQKLIEGSITAMVFTDEEGFIQNYNKAAEEAIADDLLIGKSFYDYFDEGFEIQKDIDNLLETSLEHDYHSTLKFRLKDSYTEIQVEINILINEVDYSRSIYFHILGNAE